tara:strand:+ start:11291 stop:12022 length:732 start_codon:yes stop_codon:yes gene_type:complete
MLALGLGLAVAGTAIGAISADKAQKKAERRAKRAKEELKGLKDKYSLLDTTNPFTDMENTMEDLTINQRQFDIQSQQYAQSQSSVLSGIKEAAGSSGIGAVVDALSNDAKRAVNRATSSIGFQESQNQMKERGMARNLQNLEGEGELWSRNAEKDKVGTLLGMSQQEVAAYREQAAAAQQAKWDAIADGVDSIGNMLVQPPGPPEPGNVSEGVEPGRERPPGKYILGIRVGDVYVPPPCNGLV